MKDIKELFSDNRNGGNGIVIGGIKRYGRIVFRNLYIWGLHNKVICFCDNNADVTDYGNKVFGMPVITPQSAAAQYPCADFICTGRYRYEMRKQLNDYGILKVHCMETHPLINRYGNDYGGFDVFPLEPGEGKTKIVYSFGIGEDLSFSEALLDNEDVEIYAFDPTPRAKLYVENHALYSNSRFHFFSYGISDKDGKERFYFPRIKEYVSGSVIAHKEVDADRSIEVEMKSLKTIMKELGHESVDILKMDIEGSEFKVIPQILNDGIFCKEICIETHERFFENSNDVLEQFLDKVYDSGYFAIAVGNEDFTFIRGC